tara:strand:- start:1 stop:531 length:531 start_codon:yes stop_codon:yes gene_type:complete
MGLVYIASVTASADATVEFTGIDATYNEYQFHFVNMHPAAITHLSFQVNAVGQTGFNETITSTFFRADHYEDDSQNNFAYLTSSDQAQGTAYQRFSFATGVDNDQSTSGVLTLYAPSSTTYVKHFVARSNNIFYGDVSQDFHVAGYINTTAAIDEISFQMVGGNIDAGTIHMYGVG